MFVLKTVSDGRKHLYPFYKALERISTENVREIAFEFFRDIFNINFFRYDSQRYFGFRIERQELFKKLMFEISSIVFDNYRSDGEFLMKHFRSLGKSSGKPSEGTEKSSRKTEMVPKPPETFQTFPYEFDDVIVTPENSKVPSETIGNENEKTYWKKLSEGFFEGWNGFLEYAVPFKPISFFSFGWKFDYMRASAIAIELYFKSRITPTNFISVRDLKHICKKDDPDALSSFIIKNGTYLRLAGFVRKEFIYAEILDVILLYDAVKCFKWYLLSKLYLDVNFNYLVRPSWKSIRKELKRSSEKSSEGSETEKTSGKTEKSSEETEQSFKSDSENETEKSSEGSEQIRQKDSENETEKSSGSFEETWDYEIFRILEQEAIKGSESIIDSPINRIGEMKFYEMTIRACITEDTNYDLFMFCLNKFDHEFKMHVLEFSDRQENSKAFQIILDASEKITISSIYEFIPLALKSGKFDLNDRQKADIYDHLKLSKFQSFIETFPTELSDHLQKISANQSVLVKSQGPIESISKTFQGISRNHSEDFKRELQRRFEKLTKGEKFEIILRITTEKLKPTIETFRDSLKRQIKFEVFNHFVEVFGFETVQKDLKDDLILFAKNAVTQFVLDNQYRHLVTELLKGEKIEIDLSRVSEVDWFFEEAFENVLKDGKTSQFFKETVEKINRKIFEDFQNDFLK